MEYIKPLLEILWQLVNKSLRHVKEQALTAVAAVADCAQEEFRPYYAPFVEPVLQVL